ncbi:MAG: DNA polymerase III subunit delta [Calditrichaeota bacterium]|nr:MAG: DNA polymerase III subunit delta [Calditrichota bacterium]
MPSTELSKFKQPEDLPAVVFIAGPESFLVNEYTQKIITLGVSPENRDFNLDVFHGADVEAHRVIDIAKSYPMMAPRRVVVVKEIQKMPRSGLNAVIEYAKRPNPTTCLVLTANDLSPRQKFVAALQKVALFIPCKQMYERETLGWIQKEVARQGHRIEPTAASLLALQVGTHLQNLKNEIEKLLLYVNDREMITAADVAAIAGFRKEYTIFSLQNALGERDLLKALKILSVLRTNMPVQVILSQLARFFNNLLIATGFQPGPKHDATLAKLTGVSPYFVKDLHKFKKKYSVQEVENALENLRQVDYSLKTFPVKEDLIMEQLLVHITRGYSASQLPFAAKI